jgi:hypothetical protein
MIGAEAGTTKLAVAPVCPLTVSVALTVPATVPGATDGSDWEVAKSGKVRL